MKQTVCQNCQKPLRERDSEYSVYKFKKALCFACSPLNDQPKPNTQEQAEFLATNSVEDIPF